MHVVFEHVVDGVLDNVVASDEAVYGSPADGTNMSCYPTVGRLSDAQGCSDSFELRVATKAFCWKELVRDLVPVINGAGGVWVEYVDLFIRQLTVRLFGGSCEWEWPDCGLCFP
jgi:hypothetical protein